jgi:hypothetical protein
MKLALVIGSLAFSTLAFGASKYDQFNCKTVKVIEGNKPTQVTFIVKDIDSGKASLEAVEDEDSPIEMVPKDSILDLNDNWTFNIKKDRLEITSDGDGCQWVTFDLFKDTKYLRGFVQVKGDKGCGSGDAYSKVACTRTLVELKR